VGSILKKKENGMKMRNTLLSIVAVAGLCGLHADIKADCGYNVEIMNRSPREIKIALDLTGSHISTVEPGSTWNSSRPMPKNNRVVLDITYVVLQDREMHHRFIITTKPDSTIYLTWDSTKPVKDPSQPALSWLYPQTGRFMDILGGCSKEKNVKAGDIALDSTTVTTLSIK
jgi:hypothetical protein